MLIGTDDFGWCFALMGSNFKGNSICRVSIEIDGRTQLIFQLSVLKPFNGLLYPLLLLRRKLIIVRPQITNAISPFLRRYPPIVPLIIGITSEKILELCRGVVASWEDGLNVCSIYRWYKNVSIFRIYGTSLGWMFANTEPSPFFMIVNLNTEKLGW